MSDDDDDDVPLAVLLQKSREKAAAAEKERQQLKPSSSSSSGSSSSKPNPSSSSSSSGKSHKDDDKKRKSSSGGNDAKKMKSSSSSSQPPPKIAARPLIAPKPSSSSSQPSKPSLVMPSSNGGGGNGGEKKKDNKSSNRKEEKELAKWTFLGNPEEDHINNMPRQMKHNLVVHVLKRWTYCLDPWPGALPPPPTGYVPSHNPGVYIGHSTTVLGKIHDSRPNEPGKHPSMNSLLTLHSKVLQELLVKGIEAQLKELDPEANRRLVKQLKKELKRARRLKPNRIEGKYRAEKERVLGKSSAPSVSPTSTAVNSNSPIPKNPAATSAPATAASDADSQDFEDASKGK